MDCPKCHGELSLLSTSFHLETYRCNACGEETFALVVFPSELGTEEDSREVIVLAHWKTGAAGARELRQLRRLVPALAEISLDELVRRARATPFQVGKFRKREGERLVDEGAKCGLDLRMQDPADKGPSGA